MPTPFIVLADDLTGAAEIAALGARCGRQSLVMTPEADGPAAGELLVIDTDTRLQAPLEAARQVGALASRTAVAKASWVFKKTDSVLRGPVAAELAAIAAVRRQRRVLLVPGNPALGRIVRHGRYLVENQPLHLTAFARDPHHPASTDSVVELLGKDGPLPVVSCSLSTTLPMSGLVVGDAESDADLAVWAERVDADTLPAGAAGFCRALLQCAGWDRLPPPAPLQRDGPVLILSGTISPAALPLPPGRLPARVDVPADALHDGAAQRQWEERVADTLAREHAAHVATRGIPVTADVPSRLGKIMHDLVATLHRRHAFAHLVVEGGATASALVRSLGWTRLHVTHEWAQGVVTLRPAPESGVDLTIKPGSYAWPPAWGKLWFDP